VTVVCGAAAFGRLAHVVERCHGWGELSPITAYHGG
jgi:hypothetical protein